MADTQNATATLIDERSGVRVAVPPAGAPPLVVGRAPDAALRVADPSVSRYQFQLFTTPRGTLLENLSGTNVTHHEGAPVVGSVRVVAGARIQAGESAFRFEAAESDRTRSGVWTHTEASLRLAGVAPDALATRSRTVLGRDAAVAELVIAHPTVSRRHATVTTLGAAARIEDHGSCNGTFVNGERVRGARPLVPGDRIAIGPWVWVWGAAPGAEPAPRRACLRAIDLVREVPAPGGGTQRLLDEVSLAIAPNEFICLLGPSGSGKSTLLRALCGRAPAEQGRVWLGAADLYSEFESLKAGLAVVSQREILHEDLTAARALYYTARLRLPTDTAPEEAREAALEALASVDLAHRADVRIGELSGGERKRASLASEILCRPNVLFLDEVTSGLDEGTDWEMMQLLRRLADRGMTIVCVTHTVANVEEFADRVVLMAPGGSLAFVGAPSEAPAWFRVPRLGAVYRALDDRDGAEWRKAFEASPAYRDHVLDLLDSVTPPVGGEEPTASSPPPSGRVRAGPGELLRQLGILSRRYVETVVGDRRGLALAAAQSLIVAAFIMLPFGTPPAGDPKQLGYLFLVGLSGLWFGANNASKEIVKERAIHLHERDGNVSPWPYLASKFLVLAALGAAQLALMAAALELWSAIPGGAGAQAPMLLLTLLAGTAMGLAISALAATPDQATFLVPIVLIPQIALGGLIVPDLPPVADAMARWGITAYWSYDGLKQTLLEQPATGSLARVALHAGVLMLAAGSILALRDRR